MLLINGDCIEEMKSIEDNSVDLIFCDLPYGQTSLKWDVVIPWDDLWRELARVKKLNTPIFFTTTTKFGIQIINSAPKKIPFRYDIVWVKSSNSGFLTAKKMPMRKHEMIYVFYEKLPLYDLSSHSHKFIKESVNKRYGKDGVDNKDHIKNRSKVEIQTSYDPPLPVSVLADTIYGGTCNGETNSDTEYRKLGRKNGEPAYEPALPNSIINVKSVRGNHSTEKPVELIKWILKYYSKEGDVVLDPTCGSGSSGVACIEMSRDYIGIEKDEEIFKVAKSRLNI